MRDVEVTLDELDDSDPDGAVYRVVTTRQLIRSRDELPPTHWRSWDEIERERERLAGETVGEAAYAYYAGLGSPERWGR